MPRKEIIDENQMNLQLGFAKHPSRDELLREFTQRRDELQAALEAFSAASIKLGSAASGDNPDAKDEMLSQTKATRAAINRMVRTLAFQSGIDFQSLWTLAYHELFKRTSFHAVSASKGKGTHLDHVEAAGKLPDLQDTVADMMVDPRFQGVK